MRCDSPRYRGNLNDWRSLQREGPRIPCGRRVDYRRLGGNEALIASDTRMCISSFEPITYGYVYGGDIARCSVDDCLEENPAPCDVAV